MERARKYYVDDGEIEYLIFRYQISAEYKLPLDGFGSEARRRRKVVPMRPVASVMEPVIRGPLHRLALERTAFARLVCPPLLFRMLMKSHKVLSHKLVRMELNLQELGFDEGWPRLRGALQGAIAQAVNEIQARQREDGLGAEAYAMKSIAQRRQMREMPSENSSSSDIERNLYTRGKLVCSACYPEAQAQQGDRPCVPRWWVAMLRGIYRTRADIGTIERTLLRDSEARLCVVYGIVMVVIVREGEEPHLLVLDMEPLGSHKSHNVSRSKPKRNTGLREKTKKKARASYKRKRWESGGNEHEPLKRRRGSSSPLSRG